MISAFAYSRNQIVPVSSEGLTGLSLAWIDLYNPTRDEEIQVEKLLGIDIPTRDDIREIEVSNTLYQENGTAYATASLVTQSDTPEPELHPVSFILTQNVLITLRYAEPKAFRIFLGHIGHVFPVTPDGPVILIELLDTIVGRAADALEKATRTIEDNTKKIFRSTAAEKNEPMAPRTNFQDILFHVGGVGSLVSKTNEAVVSLLRLAGYIARTPHFSDRPDELRRLDSIIRDAAALRDYANSLSDKVSFMLDATLGMISIEQNAIIKIFSVAAVIFLPPTLIASMYGMNFHHMPELNWHFGYPMALGMMAFSAWLPYRYFKRKGWL